MKVAINWFYCFDALLSNNPFYLAFCSKEVKENYAESSDTSEYIQKDIGLQTTSKLNHDYRRLI